MRFWDTSALAPLLSREPASESRQALLAEDPLPVVWWGTRLECLSAIVRKARETAAAHAATEAAVARLDALSRGWLEILPTDSLRATAERNLRVHALRTADALQLAAALEACRFDPRRLPFVCADERLADAARKEGFAVLR